MVIRELTGDKLVEYNFFTIKKDGKYLEIKKPIRIIADFGNSDNIMNYLKNILNENRNNPLG